MELTIDEIRRQTKSHLLSYDGVRELYADLYNKIFYKARDGLTDILIYKEDYINKEPFFYILLKLFKLDGFEITRFNNDEIVNIGW